MTEDDDESVVPEVIIFHEMGGDDPDLELHSKLFKLLPRIKPDETFINDIEKLNIDTLNDTVENTVNFWEHALKYADSINLMEQRSKHELMKAKGYFLIFIYQELLKMDSWKPYHQEIYKCINRVLLQILAIATKYPHKPKDLHGTTIHFQVKRFLCEYANETWKHFIDEHFPVSLLLPTMRRLGMCDVLDPDWNLYGPWDTMLTEIRDENVFVERIPADDILQKKSFALNKARNSIQCRGIAKNPNLRQFHNPPPQCFSYFPKCSLECCQNIETREKPHVLRCEKCWYFHFCSKACQDYTALFQMHDCDFTPPEKAEKIRKETEAFLGWSERKKIKEHKICHFCHTLRDNTDDKKLLQCSQCESVAYCDKMCQLNDWIAGGHKSVCSKKKG